MAQSYFERTGKLGRKIDIFYSVGKLDGKTQWQYACTTQWHKTCRDAKAEFMRVHDVPSHHVKARFSI